MSRKAKGWIREDMVAIKDKKDKRACGFRKTKEVYSDDQLWTLLKKYDRQKALLSASIGKMDYRKTRVRVASKCLRGKVWLPVMPTASSRLERYPRECSGAAQRLKLLQIRNPGAPTSGRVRGATSRPSGRNILGSGRSSTLSMQTMVASG